MSNSVFNITWDANATQRGLDKAAQRVASAVEKGTQRVVDESKNSRKAIVDAVGKIKLTNNAEQPTAHSSSASALHRSLQSIATATAEVAERTRTHPADIPAALQSAKSIAKQFTDLTDQASRYADENRRFHKTANDVQRSAGWIGSSFCGAGNQCAVNNSFGMPVVGSFNELFTE